MKKKLLLAGLGVVGLCILIITVWIVLVFRDLPDVSVLAHYRPAAAAEVLDKDGSVLTQYYEHKFRIWTPLSSLPAIAVSAVVTAEDDTFFEHKGVSMQATWDAFLHDLKKKKFARGGSTITQQMIKNVLLSKEKTLARKVREFVLAKKAEELLTKRQILEIYLNEVEWGENIYGIEAASRYYFDKHASELTVAEAALLAGMLPNPHYFDPFKRAEKARERQERVLFNMFQAKLILEEEYRSALSVPLELRKEMSGRFDFLAVRNGNGRPCYQKALERVLLSLFGEHALYRQGLKIRTTIDGNLERQLISWLEQPGDKEKVSEDPAGIIVIKEGNAVRALVCSSNEGAVRFKLESLGPPYDGYEIVKTSPGSVLDYEIVISGGDAGT